SRPRSPSLAGIPPPPRPPALSRFAWPVPWLLPTRLPTGFRGCNEGAMPHDPRSTSSPGMERMARSQKQSSARSEPSPSGDPPPLATEPQPLGRPPSTDLSDPAVVLKGPQKALAPSNEAPVAMSAPADLRNGAATADPHVLPVPSIGDETTAASNTFTSPED